eukprot:TRINITY_DN3748_c0_g1_i1.p3 TRINITY_DN3748_c0_g1~~TRINITY_DN3748_c0_g1_i1.p3  ORF type:complete len:212 (+),score=-13.48 TRINITY_DN3748_c0_g1_i1:600-1235(+)
MSQNVCRFSSLEQFLFCCVCIIKCIYIQYVYIINSYYYLYYIYIQIVLLMQVLYFITFVYGNVVIQQKFFTNFQFSFQNSFEYILRRTSQKKIIPPLVFSIRWDPQMRALKLNRFLYIKKLIQKGLQQFLPNHKLSRIIVAYSRGQNLIPQQLSVIQKNFKVQQYIFCFGVCFYMFCCCQPFMGILTWIHLNCVFPKQLYWGYILCIGWIL